MLCDRRDYWQPDEHGKPVRIAIGSGIELEDHELGICDEHLLQRARPLLREYGDETDTLLDLDDVGLKRLTDRNLLVMAKVLYQR